MVGDPKGAHLLGQGVVSLDGTSQNRGVSNIKLKASFFEELACLHCLFDTLWGQVNIVPACESIFEVPGRLTVTDEDNFVEGLCSAAHFLFSYLFVY